MPMIDVYATAERSLTHPAGQGPGRGHDALGRRTRGISLFLTTRSVRARVASDAMANRGATATRPLSRS